MATLGSSEKRHKVTVVGSGNWGSAIAKIVAENTAAHPNVFEPEVQMWVFEETIQLSEDSRHYDQSSELCTKPQKLTTLINHFHENVKYLPNITLPKNLVANPNLRASVKDSTILIFNLPHQFINRTCDDLKGHILPYARGVSCVKGVDVSADKISLFSDTIAQKLGIYCGALSGANIANEVAAEKFSETTIGYDPPLSDSREPTPSSSQTDLSSMAKRMVPSLTMTPSDDVKTHSEQHPSVLPSHKLAPLPQSYPPLDHQTLKTLFHRPYFHVHLVSDVTSVSLSGALKNIVALAAGFVVGLGWGDNAKSAIMRVGLLEMVRFGLTFFPDSGISKATFMEESCGVADLITSCSSGRNFRCAKMCVEEGISIEEVEKRVLNGQILQGVGTAKEVNAFLKARGREGEFPLFTGIHNILEGKAKAADIPSMIDGETS